MSEPLPTSMTPIGGHPPKTGEKVPKHKESNSSHKVFHDIHADEPPIVPSRVAAVQKGGLPAIVSAEPAMEEEQLQAAVAGAKQEKPQADQAQLTKDLDASIAKANSLKKGLMRSDTEGGIEFLVEISTQLKKGKKEITLDDLQQKREHAERQLMLATNAKTAIKSLLCLPLSDEQKGKLREKLKGFQENPPPPIEDMSAYIDEVCQEIGLVLPSQTNLEAAPKADSVVKLIEQSRRNKEFELHGEGQENQIKLRQIVIEQAKDKNKKSLNKQAETLRQRQGVIKKELQNLSEPWESMSWSDRLRNLDPEQQVNVLQEMAIQLHPQDEEAQQGIKDLISDAAATALHGFSGDREKLNKVIDLFDSDLEGVLTMGELAKQEKSIYEEILHGMDIAKELLEPPKS